MRFQSESQLFIRTIAADRGRQRQLVSRTERTLHRARRRLVATSEIDKFYQWRSGSQTLFFYYHEWPGFDDLLTRGNGSLRMPARHNWGVDYTSAIIGRYRYEVAAFIKEQGFGQYTRQLRFIPKWFLTENLSVDANLNYYDSPNWLIWTAGPQWQPTGATSLTRVSIQLVPDFQAGTALQAAMDRPRCRSAPGL